MSPSQAKLQLGREESQRKPWRMASNTASLKRTYTATVMEPGTAR